jgi:hypothetical protein
MRFLKTLLYLLRTLAYGWIAALRKLIGLACRWLRAACRTKVSGIDRDAKSSRAPCVPIDDPAFVRPDPLIYAQYYLMSLGLAVTWDNPDIHLRLNGVPVQPHELKPATTYEVVARIWNGSTDCPVVAMPVHFSYLDFGAGTHRIGIATTTVDLGVKGGPGCPAEASVPWTTPTTPGHYCIQVLLDPADDSNRLNNLGQTNTDVKPAHSAAVFEFTLRNDTARQHSYRFETDAYRLLDLDPCATGPEAQAARRQRLARQQRGMESVPPGWVIDVSPATPALSPGQSVMVTVTVTPPPGFTGAQPLNVHAFHEDGLAGGVTLTVTG